MLNRQAILPKKLHEWVEQLPERQREAFELSRFEGLDHEEIAQVMQVSAANREQSSGCSTTSATDSL